MSQHIKHRGGDGAYKASPSHRSALPAGQISMEDIARIELSISDADLETALDTVGAQLLGMEPQGTDKQRIALTIAGRNPLAVRYACWEAATYWPGARDWQLLVIPDVVRVGNELPPNYVRMLDPRVICSFSVVGGLP